MSIKVTARGFLGFLYFCFIPIEGIFTMKPEYQLSLSRECTYIDRVTFPFSFSLTIYRLL